MSEIESKILNTQSGKLNDVAEVVYYLFHKEYKYENGRWKHLVNGEWKDDGDGLTLRRKIHTKLVNEFLRVIVKYNTTAFDQKTKGEKDKYFTISKNLGDLALYLRTQEYREKLLCNCASLWSQKSHVN